MIESLRAVLQSASEQFHLLLGLERNVENVNSGQMALRAILVYALALLLVRIGSKRFLSQATAFDVIVAIMLGSILSRAINGSAPFVPTILAGGALLAAHWVFATIAASTSFFGPLVKGEPRLLIKDGQVQEEEMRAAQLSKHDLEQALRLQNRQDPSRIKRAYLERNGSISIIPFENVPHILEVATERGVQTIRIKLE
ncbi:DUF421 domain-containing protein [Pseudaminobacter sp. 19-2017]|uniref:DUF421 domain-containing protein n=1 Tax=Pseudaminobacter soli (ex Zhang et al. 2022) TaxID=2831468 RepID=A0A942I9G6_9HYPH|nr:DUF421 domain-containing protein [Pseudaminobacter soli]